jgi:hypothetical protein
MQSSRLYLWRGKMFAVLTVIETFARQLTVVRLEVGRVGNRISRHSWYLPCDNIYESTC